MNSEIWDDIGRKVSQAADSVSRKAGKTADLVRLKNQVYSLEREMTKDYTDLGKMLYERYLSKGEVEEAFRPICEAITQKEILADEYRGEIADLKREI